MARYNMQTKLVEVINDEEAMNIIRGKLMFICSHPRFSEAYDYSFDEIVKDNMGEVVGIPEEVIKATIDDIMSLE